MKKMYKNTSSLLAYLIFQSLVQNSRVINRLEMLEMALPNLIQSKLKMPDKKDRSKSQDKGYQLKKI